MMGNAPPQILVSEMTIRLPCTDNLFEAETADLFARVLSDGHGDSEPRSIASLIVLILSDHWAGRSHHAFRKLNASLLLSILMGKSDPSRPTIAER